MTLRSALPFATAFLKARLLRRRTPLIVSWAVTRRCNYRCAYCGSWRAPGPELEPDRICSLVDELAREGCRQIMFTGGEPLLKEGIEQFVERAATHGIRVGINSNGTLVPKKLPDLEGLRTLTLSLDGPETVHDRIRGPGAFAHVMKALEAAKGRALELRFLTVLSSENLGEVPFVLDRAQAAGARVFFQPATPHVLLGESPNPHAPPDQEYRRTMDELIAEKRSSRYGGVIANSLTGLAYLRNLPQRSPIPCAGGLLFCRITPAGEIKGCDELDFPRGGNNAAEVGVRNALETVPLITCDRCWCASRLEVNELMMFKPEVAWNMIRLDSQRPSR